MQREFEEMLEHTRQTVAGLHSIEVEAWDDPSEPGQPHVVITAWRDGAGLEPIARGDERWERW